MLSRARPVAIGLPPRRPRVVVLVPGPAAADGPVVVAVPVGDRRPVIVLVRLRVPPPGDAGPAPLVARRPRRERRRAGLRGRGWLPDQGGCRSLRADRGRGGSRRGVLGRRGGDRERVLALP